MFVLLYDTIHIKDHIEKFYTKTKILAIKYIYVVNFR